MDYLFKYSGKKSDILKASLELFAARGYDAVSVRDIAKKAGVSEAALYKHFAGKEEMARYIFTAIITEYSRRLKEVEQQQLHCIDKLCRIVEITYDLYYEYPAEIRFALLTQYIFWDQLDNEIKPHFIIRSILEAGMAAGEIPQHEVYFWISVFSGVMLQPLSQYTYFGDVLPEFRVLKGKVTEMVRKLFA